MSSFEFELMDTGPGILLAVFGSEISEKTNKVIRAFCKRLEEQCLPKPTSTSFLEGVSEWVPAYCTVTIYYDPFVVSREKLSRTLQSFAEKCVLDSDEVESIHEVPVCYEESFAPDLKNVMSHSGLTREQVIELHSKNSYLVYMLGFLPGFVYLGGLDEQLATPRLAEPRMKIPAGSVAIGGEQTGIYPVDSPGGWQIIGKTPLKLYDPQREPPVLFKAGDKIKFVPIDVDEYTEIEKKERAKIHTAASERKEAIAPNIWNPKTSEDEILLGTYVATSGIKILNGGLLTTVQDGGRFGYQRDGFCVSGAMDSLSYKLANIIAGNEPDAAVLETTFSGPEIRFALAADFVITGANQNPMLDGIPVPLYTRIHAREGSVLSLGMAVSGMRSYLAFTGGIVVPQILGSRSTSLKYQLGGYCGRKLLAGDELAIGEVRHAYQNIPVLCEESQKLFLQEIQPLCPVKKILALGGAALLIRVVPGPQFSMFAAEGIVIFSKSEYIVSPESDRMGYRFTGQKVESVNGTDIISDGIVFGSVQIPSSGMPMVMMADHQTAGGYAKIATVIDADLSLLAQCAPGTKVKFVFVTQSEALSLLREQEVLLRIAQETVIELGDR